MGQKGSIDLQYVVGVNKEAAIPAGFTSGFSVAVSKLLVLADDRAHCEHERVNSVVQIQHRFRMFCR